MKIYGSSQISPVSNRYSEVARKNYVSSASLIGNDKVEFSENAKIFSTALKAARDIPDVRTEKVEGLRKSIADGTYRIDSNKVAEKIINHIKLV